MISELNMRIINHDELYPIKPTISFKESMAPLCKKTFQNKLASSREKCNAKLQMTCNANLPSFIA